MPHPSQKSAPPRPVWPRWSAANDGVRELAAIGREIYLEGIPEFNIVPCAACHGPNAEGIRDIPRLGGLSYSYLKRRLEQWGEGYHAAAPPPMPRIAGKLPPNEILREHGSRSAMQHKARCAIEAPGSADGVRRLAGGMARAYRYQAESILARRSTNRAIGLQLTIVAPSFTTRGTTTPRFKHFFSAPAPATVAAGSIGTSIVFPSRSSGPTRNSRYRCPANITMR
jgi:cytochrome c553